MQFVGAVRNDCSSSPRLDEPPSDRELDEMVKLHAAELLARARVLTRQSSDAWDLFQETFERAFRRRPPALSNEESRRWLLVVMNNLHLDQCRTAKRRHAVALAEGDLTTTAEDEREEPVWRSVDVEQVRGCLGRLDPRLRDAYVLYTEAGLPLAAIAKKLGIPVATVGTRLFRARRRLRELLVENGAPDGRRTVD